MAPTFAGLLDAGLMITWPTRSSSPLHQGGVVIQKEQVQGARLSDNSGEQVEVLNHAGMSGVEGNSTIQRFGQYKSFKATQILSSLVTHQILTFEYFSMSAQGHICGSSHSKVKIDFGSMFEMFSIPRDSPCPARVLECRFD
jgi:hypothetical protein